MNRGVRILVVALLALGLGLLGRWRSDDGSRPRSPPPSRSGSPTGAEPADAEAFGWTGECTRVHDGDTLSVRGERETVRIRIFGIDAPERSQGFSNRARSRLRELAEGRRVRVLPVETDSYGRQVARVEADGEDLGRRLIGEGLAWHYDRYSDDAAYARAEAEARGARRGLWTEPAPVPPWVFRQRARGAGHE